LNALGNIEFGNTGQYSFPAPTIVQEKSDSPAWFQISTTTASESNVISFGYQFLSDPGAEGILTLFVDDTPMYRIDERTTPAGLNIAKHVQIGDLQPGLHRIGFRLDPFSDVHSIVQISDIQLGLVTVQHIIDTFAPTTTPVISGTLGNNGWYISTTTIALNASDNPGGIGVASTTYSLDGGPWQTYSTTSPISITTDGGHSLRFFSTDLLGNQEATNTLQIKIDKTAPEAKFIFDPVGQSLNIIGTDNLSTTTVQTTATSSLITDQAGHTLQIFFTQPKPKDRRINLSISSLKYDGLSATSYAVLKYKWKTDKSSIYSLFAAYEKTATSSLEAHYRPKKGNTIIMQAPQDFDDSDHDDDADSRPLKQALPGLVIPFLKTNGGAVTPGY